MITEMFDFDTYHYEVVMRPSAQGSDTYFIRSVSKVDPANVLALCKRSRVLELGIRLFGRLGSRWELDRVLDGCSNAKEAFFV